MSCKTQEYEFQISEIPSLYGHVIIVTGGNSGVGYETSLNLAKRGARVYIASRSQERVNKAIASMKQDAGPLDLHFLKLDLQDLQSVKATAAEFMSKEPRLDILINNAGIMASPWELTKDGFEIQWQTCFLSHHTLTMSLMPALLAAVQASGEMNRVRVVNVASDAAVRMGSGSINYEDPNLTELSGTFAPWKRYGQCKLASIKGAKAINDRYQHSGVTAYSLHPGLIKSNLQSHDTTILGTMARAAFKVAPSSTALDGSRTSLFCATSPKAIASAGLYHVPFGKVDAKVNKWVHEPESVDKLWVLANGQLKKHGFVIDNLPMYSV
ncbi:reductase [Fusarium albosuccineum]|uniref:Reductase n=1 Tax=Fusarium albosuccineum TaxID=1237068 RepID=A0A8H4L1G1_9HYPO|nr:reductase [Fusarium albosuccineum]